MRTIRLLVYSILSFAIFAASCKKHEVRSELSKLPGATQTGERSFGCLIDGKAFVVKNHSVIQGPDITARYEHRTEYGYYLYLSGANKNPDGTLTIITLLTDSLAVSQGKTVQLVDDLSGQASASYTILTANATAVLQTTKILSGELTITRLNTINGIISGTFSFTALDNNNRTIKITDGRFDTLLF